MSAPSLSAPDDVRQWHQLASLTAVGCVLAVLGSVGYISMNGMTPREAFAHPMNIVVNTLVTVGALLIAFALVRWRPSLPGWAVTTAAAGLTFVVANAWYFATGLVTVANNTDDALFEELIFNDSWVFVMAGPKAVLCLVGFLALAISGWRNRSIPRPAAALLGIAAVLSIWPPYPPGLIVASLALFLISRARMAQR